MTNFLLLYVAQGVKMGEFQNGRKGLKQDNQLQHFSLLWIVIVKFHYLA